MTAEITSLSNGMTIVSDTMDHMQSAAIGVWVGTGSRHEVPATHGISHMLEHMAFKGTKRRSARAIVEEIEAVGGHLNAHTTHETTAYYARILKDDLPLAADILADILQHSTFEPDEVAREQGVIVQEIGQAADTPDDLVFDMLLSAAFKDQALGRSILGTPDTVRSFDGAALNAYMGAHYNAPKLVLSGAGGLAHGQLVELGETLLTDLPDVKSSVKETAHFTGTEAREEKDLEQAHVTLAFEGVPYGDPDYYTAQVFSTVLGGGMSSRLFQEVREKRGLCYSVYSFNWSFDDTGLFGIYAGTAETDLAELVPVIADEVCRLGEDASAQETQRAKAQLKAGLLMGMESSASRVEQIARQQMIFGRILSVEEITAKVDAVDELALRRFVKRLTRSTPALSALGPIATLETHDRLAARFT
ncbi:MAG: pitrilysin family protein [Parvibaculum sp.]